MLAFLLAYFAKRGHLRITKEYLDLLPVFFFAWLGGTLLGGKFFSRQKERRFSLQVAPFVISAFLSAGLFSFICYFQKIIHLSFFILFGTLILHLVLELLLLSGNYLKFVRQGQPTGSGYFPLLFIGLEAMLAFLLFAGLQYYRSEAFIFSQDHKAILFILLISWFCVSLLVHRFRLPDLHSDSWLKSLEPYLRSQVILLSFFFIILYSLRLFHEILYLPLLVIATLCLFELVFVSFYIFFRSPEQSDLPMQRVHDDDLESARLIVAQARKDAPGKSRYSFSGENERSSLLAGKLQDIYLAANPKIFAFLDSALELSSFNIMKSEFLSSSNPYNFQVLPDNREEFIMNLRDLNSFRFINRYLMIVNRKLVSGGVLVGSFQPLELRWSHFLERYPRGLARILYFLEFIWKRIFPKMPVLQRFYFFVSKGRDRIFSFAQALGRLYYCGFSIVSQQVVGSRIYFVAKKSSMPSENKNPSYGLVFRQQRVGLNGKAIGIYKMRTMHPFSEFIHDFILERNPLDEKGKVSNDFRITSWGRFLRKFWIDEIPMLLNLLKGDLKLVGVRPLSKTFFNTYPADLQEMRVRYKPGLIPPYYADLPGNMEEVWDSERRYLQAYAKKPWTTDFKYFCRAFRNIVFRGAKSA